MVLRRRSPARSSLFAARTRRVVTAAASCVMLVTLLGPTGAAFASGWSIEPAALPRGDMNSYLSRRLVLVGERLYGGRRL